MYFQLLIGLYQDAKGRNYWAGDIIETESDLVKNFGSSKFRRLTAEEAARLRLQAPAAKVENIEAERAARVDELVAKAKRQGKVKSGA